MGPSIHALLIQHLAAPKQEVRDQASARLIAAGKAAVPELVDALGSPDADVRAGAARCLGGIGFTGAARVLGAMAEADADSKVRTMALRALSDLASRDSPTVIKCALLKHLGSADMFARALACRGLGRIGDEECCAALQQALKDPEPWVREAAGQGLHDSHSAGRPEGTAAVESSQALVPRSASSEVQRLLAELAGPDLGLQLRAHHALVELGPLVVEPVAELLANPASPARRAAVEVLGALGDPSGMAPLATLLADESATSLQPAVLHAMARIMLKGDGASSAAFPLHEVRMLMQHADHLVRAGAGAALISYDGSERRAAVTLALQDPEEWVRSTAMQVLSRVACPADRELAPLLVAQLPLAEAPETQLHILLALGRIHVDRSSAEPSLLGPVSFFLHSEDPAVRMAAGRLIARMARQVDPSTLAGLLDLAEQAPSPELIEALARLAAPQDAAAVELLRRLMYERAEREREVAERAAQALAALGSRQSVGVLVEAANSREGSVVALAAQALAAIDPRAHVVAARQASGSWEIKLQYWCSVCAGALHWVQSRREELRCTQCNEEYVLATGGAVYPAARTPLGTCLCPECRRKQPLVRRADTQVLFCPLSGRVHIRPYDRPRQLRLLDDLPLGACACCADPQPLIRLNEDVVCYRTHQRYRPTAHGYEPAVSTEANADEVSAINQALLAGTIGVGLSGVATAARMSGDDERGGNDGRPG